ncbi:helix-turn-helix transcriptional regulator [Enterobacter ludwigii]|nr:helix-turn-helix transcriptional regulator [Enterobacter ludwigii]
MAWLDSDVEFNPDTFNNVVVGVQAQFCDHDSGLHQHSMSQILFARQGCVTLSMNNGSLICLLPPSRAAWIPAGLSHRAEMKKCVDYRSIWFDTRNFPFLPFTPAILNVSPLLFEIMERISEQPWDTHWDTVPYCYLVRLCEAEICAAAHEPMILKLPKDRRLTHLSYTELPPTLQQLALYTGASEKTISRIFRRDTGMSFLQWRQQWRLMKAVEMLCDGKRITDTAQLLGFASDSAFIYFFRSMTGVSPRKYFLGDIGTFNAYSRVSMPE